MANSCVGMRRFGRMILAVAGLCAATVALAQPVTLERDSPLYAEARFESKVVANLKQGAAGEVVGKSGAWVNVKTPEASGWLLSFNVRFVGSGAGESGRSASGGRPFTQRQQVSVTSTIGIRGLGEEDLRQAQFNEGQMALLDKFVASRADAEAAAGSSGLAPSRVEYIGAPAP